MSPATNWTTAADIRARLRRRWRSGELLTLWSAGEPFPEVEFPLRGPSARELADHLAPARAWAEAIGRGSEGGRAFDVVDTQVGGRHLGRTTIPGRARIGTYDQAWHLLGVREDVHRYRELLETTPEADPAHGWARAHPMKALEVAGEWPHLLRASQWLRRNRGSGKYLREVSAPGIDTKFLETHRKVLAEILGVRAGAADFTTDLGLNGKPAQLRLRFAPGAFGLPHPLTEAQLRVEEFQALAAGAGRGITRVLLIENEITYLSVPVPPEGVVMWGRGYAVNHPGSLAWLHDREVAYWGDIDSHGFAILNRLRRHLPNVTSVLMDEPTLLSHADTWVQEPRPTAADLTHLTPTEFDLYRDLVTDRFAERIRLEQEYVDWRWALDRLQEIGFLAAEPGTEPV
ncbi:MAG TPA: Wadjet anti-phage system protein JetD domain-containing protein [Beutenbergiaceae bacterium]|nr:Wadjet anti-phage system protein JetD domain-containing protein [Beutenbergiaceae bacterium]